MPRARLLRGLVLAAVWWGVSLAVGVALFLNSSRTVVLASHDATLRPTLDGYVVLHTGPVLPDLRLESPSFVGVDVQLGKTNADTTEGLVSRYAYIASQPEGQIAKVRHSLVSMAWAAALRGAALGIVPVLVWVLVGPARRRDLVARARSRRGVVLGLVLLLMAALLWQPWRGRDVPEDEPTWTTLRDYLAPDIPVPDQVAMVEIRTDATTVASRRLIESAIDTYEKSRVFYAAATEEAAGLELRTPGEDETVVALVSDRHDNIGMDAVARAVADAGGATAVFDAGDDTSSGQSWEAFSLDSVTAAFEDVDRYAVAGNHDNGDFVTEYLDDLGWQMLDGEVVDGPGGISLLGLDDPRSSGLGSWRDETGLSFDEVGSRLSEVACAEEEPVGTIVVHDVNLARRALEQGCADLVVGGHLHVRVGPTRVVAENGDVGYSYTTGTTGGAAYAIAIGSKPRRDAMITLLTYADGRPLGVQSVTVQTNGVFRVADFVELDLTPARPSGE
jgi:predicted phosphodiesterase